MMRPTTRGAIAAVPVVVGVLALTAPAATALASRTPGTTHQAAAAPAQVTVVQAVPDDAVSVSIDGRKVQSGAAAGSVLGPYSLTPGQHRLSFAGVEGKTLTQAFTAPSGGSMDMVLHLPQSPQGAPEVNSYLTPSSAIGLGKSRVLVAHTANFGAADIAVDGTVVFDSMTNGQFAEADVPSGSHEVAVFPAREDNEPVLGPLSMAMPASTVTMAYAYGDPTTGTMKVVTHTAALSGNGTAVPKTIHTGSAGLATGVPTSFDVPGANPASQGAAAWTVWASWALALPTLALLGLWLVRRTRTAGGTVPGGLLGTARVGGHRDAGS